MKLSIALAQMDVQIGQEKVNLSKARTFAARAREAEADLLLLPELWLHGYDLGRAEEWAAPLGEGGFGQMAALAREFSLYLAGTLLERHEGGISNTAVLYAPNGALVGSYRKVHLFRLMREHRYLIPGDRAVLFSTPWGSVGIPICYDLRFPELLRAMALAGAVILLVPAQWPVTRLDAWLTLARARAIEDELFVAACNRVGVEGDVVFPGRSCIVGPLGQVLADGDDQEQLLIAQLDLREVGAARRYLPVYDDRRPEAYQVDQLREQF
ncbi:MAG: nitrilase-related carbon-nitrogen hydrolase [Anaerolineae bacterium]|jgi:omega-amidase